LNNPKTALLVEDLHKYFGADEVLKGISLEAQEGDVIAYWEQADPGRALFCAASICWKRPPAGRFM